MKIYAWNVNGLRAVIRKKSLQNFLQSHHPDILCLGETKISAEQVKEEKIREQFPDYDQHYAFADRKGYSGTAIWIKKALGQKQAHVAPPNFDVIRVLRHDMLNEGRITAIEFNNFYLISTYVPNSKPDLSRLKVRQQWDKNFIKFLAELQRSKPLIICGDMNVAHRPIDLARPADNEGKHGYTPEERTDFTALLEQQNLLDTFRHLHPKTVAYTWWSHWGNSRTRNIGWRIDYFLISERLKTKLKTAEIHADIEGSDHCPISIEVSP